ncbi:bacillibactin transport transcriptional regulator Btr [Bacillus subtilis]|uniref:bacillibactin transport transcriptional regulator Btr n=1 Tax=Bacillus subtilis TaxID=1423 RepID=UPI0015606089|nr:bacillibactin transport transcriptional regulator Btr [Bacillus subtilis]MEC3652561.1 bacillibactin transport transcriptional regulator Btr [Bacillus subtilis]NRF02905.1 transcriptional regulator Btr [Bacillus subtilis]NRG35835.1 transcriptional regulator Btr [Bacillus subtilis]UHH05162.1 bacillibactin transport transcriptional regulator Btr [Bacillus subtilis]
MQNAVIYQPVQIEYLKKTSDLFSEQQLADSFVLIFHLKGNGYISIGTNTNPLQKKTLYVCPPNETFGFTPAADGHIDACIIRLQSYIKETGQDIFTPCTESELANLKLMNVSHIENLAVRLQELAALWNESSQLSQLKCGIEIQSLIYDLFTASLSDQADTHSAIEKTKHYIETHADTKITLAQLSQMAGISAKHYSESFKKWTGQSVTEFITKTRITKAKRLMAKSNCKLKEIAHQTGYQDEFYFSRTFKKYTGCSPTSYMKKRRKKIAAYGRGTMGHLIPLHHIPFAAALHPKWTSYYYQHYSTDIPVQLSAYRFNEKWEENLYTLSQAEPDVIVSMDSISPEEKDRLNRIAEVMYLPSEESWRTHFLQTASFLKEESEAEKWLADYDQQTTAAKKTLQHVQGLRFLFLRLHKQNFYLAHNRSVREVFFGDLGFSSATTADTPSEQAISLENIANYQADCMMLFLFKEPETIAYYQQLQQTEAWQNLSAVRNNRVYLLSLDPWNEYSACGHERIVQQTVSLLSGDCP